jgi:hypothetical protein
MRVKKKKKKQTTPLRVSKPRNRTSSSVQRFRGGLVFQAHRLLCHSTLGLRVIKKKNRRGRREVHDQRSNPYNSQTLNLVLLFIGVWITNFWA